MFRTLSSHSTPGRCRLGSSELEPVDALFNQIASPPSGEYTIQIMQLGRQGFCIRRPPLP